MIEVAAVVLEREDKILICRRTASGSCGLLWEFPGGKIEENESARQCAARECQEELGVPIRVGESLGIWAYRYPEQEVRLHFFMGQILTGEPRATVHSEIRWVKRRELQEYPFCPANQELIAQLWNEGK